VTQQEQKKFADVLKNNQTLKHFGIGGNCVNCGDDGVIAFAEMLKANKTLTGISLNKFTSTEDGAKALLEAVKVNYTLAYENVSLPYYNGKDKEIYPQIEAQIKFNSDATKKEQKMKGVVLEIKQEPVVSKNEQELLDGLLKKKQVSIADTFSQQVSIKLDKEHVPIFKNLITLLKTHQRMNTLNFTFIVYNNVPGFSTSPDIVQDINELIQSNPKIEKLTLDNLPCDSTRAKQFADILRNNQTLKQFGIGGNCVNSGDDGVIAIAEMLKANKTLTGISIGKFSSTEDGAKALLEAAKVNTTLLLDHVSLPYFSGKDKSIYPLIEAELKANSDPAKKEQKMKNQASN